MFFRYLHFLQGIFTVTQYPSRARSSPCLKANVRAAGESYSNLESSTWLIPDSRTARKQKRLLAHTRVRSFRPAKSSLLPVRIHHEGCYMERCVRCGHSLYPADALNKVPPLIPCQRLTPSSHTDKIHDGLQGLVGIASARYRHLSIETVCGFAICHACTMGAPSPPTTTT